MAAGLLSIFLGAFGVHNFYLCYKTKAIIQLLVTLLTCGLGAVVSGIWGFVEGIMILCGSISVDGYGNPLVENNSPIVVNQYNGNVINNVGNYNNDFKVKIIDRMNPIYSMDYKFKDIYVISTAAEDEVRTFKGIKEDIKGFIDCYEGTKVKVTLFAVGLEKPNDAKKDKDLLKKAYEMGCKIK